MNNILRKTASVLRTNRFFWFTIAFFIFEAAWIALSAVYPQAFDEYFHFGIIKIYSHYWLPFITGQPANANAFGAIARDPSYLYHYLMSFPYRLLALFVHDQSVQVIFLRIINIGFFTTGLILFRRVLTKASISKALAHICILIFVLIPIVPQLAAHINYDNLLLPLIAWVCLLTFKVTDDIRSRKLNISNLLVLTDLCLLTSLVKYAFLPIFASVVVFLSYLLINSYKGNYRQLRISFIEGWKTQGRWTILLLTILTIISFGMFAQRDIVNIVKYHTIVPNCSTVLSVGQCKSYSAWYADYVRHGYVVLNKSNIKYDNPVIYTGNWLYYMWYRLFFAINGPASRFTNYPPLPLPSAAAVILAIGGFVAFIKCRKKIFRHSPYFACLLFICIFYVGALWLDSYSQYRYTDTLVAMNGRYLLPVLLLIAALIGKAISYELKKSAVWKSALAILIIIFFMQGGGFLTFVTRSDSTWDWPNSKVVKINNAARRITKPIIIKGSKNYSTKLWVFN